MDVLKLWKSLAKMVTDGLVRVGFVGKLRLGSLSQFSEVLASGDDFDEFASGFENAFKFLVIGG